EPVRGSRAVQQGSSDASSASAEHVGLERVSHEDRLLRETPDPLERGLEDRGLRFLDAYLGRGDDGIDRAAEPDAGEHARERAVPVRYHRRSEPGRAQRPQHGRRVPEGDEPKRVEQELLDRFRWKVPKLRKTVANHLRASAPEVLERALVEPFPVMRAVIGEFGEHRLLGSRLWDLDPVPNPQTPS